MTNPKSSNTGGDRWDSFEAEARSPMTWVPEAPGDSLTGEYVRHEDGKSRDGSSSCEILVLETRTGPRAIWLWQTALKDLGRHAGLKPGQLIYIEYQGRRTSGTSGHEYVSFRTVVEGDEPKRAPSAPLEVARHEGQSGDDESIPF